MLQRILILSTALTALVFHTAAPCRALDATELVLVVNHNMPEGVKLAEMYAQTRQVPAQRIVELDLPTTEQMSFETYERDVVPPLRAYLRLNDPQNRIKCLVTFYGVPFRIGAHVNTPEEIAELRELHADVRDAGAKLKALVDQSEKMAASFDPTFKPAAPTTAIVAANDGAELNAQAIDSLARRVDHAGKSMMVDVQKMDDPTAHHNAEMQLVELVQRFNAPINSPIKADGGSTTTPTTQAAPTDALVAAMALEDRRFDPASRAIVRQNAAKSLGLFGYTKLLLAQIAYLSPEETEAATDSELSLLRWTYYPRPKWQLNSLCYRFGGGAVPQALMVARLDGPSPAIVRQMIVDSAHAESIGLTGRAVIDARGLPLDGPGGKPDSYAIYDESLRRLAALLHLRTTLPVTFDDLPDVLPPHSVQDVALYCGWYSVGKYVPACSFVPGAVGFHIASYEMVSLRDPGNTGWVRGLLDDGVAATIGPVSEPYLQAFPPPDEFFPLLLTGRLTLAEAYWKTEIMASWRMCLVGDPLYTPFKVHPALQVKDLPDRLQPLVGGAVPGPTTRN